MIHRRDIFAAVLGLAVIAAPAVAFAGNPHVEAAVRETKEAIHEGKQHMFSSFVEHTHNALDHAREAHAQGVDPKKHVSTAIRHLRDALKVAKHTQSTHRLNSGIQHAERALVHLKVVANEH